jgi:DNA-binding beta-propeller fold protein YncE
VEIIGRKVVSSLLVAFSMVIALSNKTIAGERLFVSLFQSNLGLAIIDSANNAYTVTYVSLPDVNARYISTNANLKEVYVSTANGNRFYIVDANLGQLKGTIREEVGWNSGESVVSPNGQTVYLATSGGLENNRQNKILVIDPKAKKVRKVIVVSPYEFPRGLSGLKISRDGRTLYTFDAATGKIVIMDAVSETIRDRVSIPAENLLAISPDGRALYLGGTNEIRKQPINNWQQPNWYFRQQAAQIAVASNTICVVSRQSNKVFLVDDIGGKELAQTSVTAPVGAVFSSDERRIYVTSGEFHAKAQSVYVIGINGSKLTRLHQIDLKSGTYPTNIEKMELNTN